MTDRSQTIESLVARALQIAQSMTATASGAAPDAQLQIDRPSFDGLARILQDVATSLSGCGGDLCMGRKVDGIRLWVTQESLAREQQLSSQLRAENARLRNTLERLATREEEAFAKANVFADPSATLDEMRTLARQAIAA